MSRRDVADARAYTRFMSDARAATVLDANPLAGLSLLLFVVTLGAGLFWASQATLNEVTVGKGSVIPSSREQIVQSLEGGILSALLVHEGDHVQKGQVLLRIDDTRYGASYRESEIKGQALRAAIARLRAEANGREPVFPSDVPPELVSVQRKLFESRRSALEEGLKALSRSLVLAQQELELTAPLVKQGAVSEVEVLRLRRQVNDLRGRIEDRRNTFRADARASLAKDEAELAGVDQVNEARRDQVRRTTIRSPMKGTVSNIRVNTIGGVIQPGERIMSIVPSDEQLLVEARIRPSDVAFLRPGLPALVKITAYDYSVYGGLQGRLEHISADTITDDKNPRERYYRIRVRTDKSHLDGKDGPLPIIPGMTAQVEIRTGQKTLLEYLVMPFVKTKDNSLRER